MNDEEMHRRIRFIAATAVASRRGLDEATIRRESLSAAACAIERVLDDQMAQESAFAEARRAIDRAIFWAR